MAQKGSSFSTTFTTAIAQAQDIMKSDSSLEDKLIKLNGLMHMGDKLLYSERAIVSHDLSMFLPGLAALNVDKTNASDIMTKNVLWQMLTHIVILNDVMATFGETFLSFVSTMFQLGFNSDLPWLFREGVLSCLTELETHYPGLLVPALARIYRNAFFESTPCVQATLVLFSLVLNHCFILSYEIALDNLKQEIARIAANPSSPQRHKSDGVKLSFKYVVSYRLFKSREASFNKGDVPDSLKDAQMVSLLKNRIRLCSPVASVYITQLLLVLNTGVASLSNNLSYLFAYCSRNIGESSSLALLANSDFLSPSFKHMVLSWYLSFVLSNESAIADPSLLGAVTHASFCNPYDISFKQLVCANLRSSQADPLSSYTHLSTTNTDSLTAVLRYILIVDQCKNKLLVQSLCRLFIVDTFRSRRDYPIVVNTMACDAFDGFFSSQSSCLVDVFSEQLDAFCLSSDIDKRVSRLLGDFLPMFSKLAFLRKNFNKLYIQHFCDLVSNNGQKSYGLTTEKASVFLHFFCSFVAMVPSYVTENGLGDDDKLLSTLKELNIDTAQLLVMIISYCSSEKTVAVPCSEQYLVAPYFENIDANDLEWDVSLQPVYEYKDFAVDLSVEALSSFPRFIDDISKAIGPDGQAFGDFRFILSFNNSIVNSKGVGKLCYGFSVELFALSSFANIDRKMVGNYGIPVVDISVASDKLCFQSSLESLSAEMPYFEKLIARLSFSTGCSKIYSSWLNPFTVELADVLIPFKISQTGDSSSSSLNEMFLSSLKGEISTIDKRQGWIDSLFKTNASLALLEKSVLRTFILFSSENNCLIGGFLPPSSVLFINFRFRGNVSRSVLTSKGTPGSVEDFDSAKKRSVGEFLEKYNNNCFAYIFTNNASLLRHCYLLLEKHFN